MNLVAVLCGKGTYTKADTVVIKGFNTQPEVDDFIKATEKDGKYWTICRPISLDAEIDTGFETFESDAWNTPTE